MGFKKSNSCEYAIKRFSNYDFPPEFYREALNSKFGFYKSDCKKMYLCALHARPSSAKFSDSPIERRMDTLEEIFFLVLKERVNIWIALNNEKESHEFIASANP